MLDAFARHSGCALQLVARGDGLDNHHLIEDVGIALGKAIYEALGEKRGIARYGSMMVPLDDALVAGSIDLSGRSFLNFNVRFDGVENLGDFKTEMIREFFRAVVDNGKFNLHLIQMNGDVAHHLCEASFKAFAKAFRASKNPNRQRRNPLHQRPARVSFVIPSKRRRGRRRRGTASIVVVEWLSLDKLGMTELARPNPVNSAVEIVANEEAAVRCNGDTGGASAAPAIGELPTVDEVFPLR